MHALPVLLSALLLAGCGTLQIGERHFIRADTSAHARPKRLDQAALLALIPHGVLRDETVGTPDGAVLRGVSWRAAAGQHVVLYFGGNMFHLDQHGADVLPQLASCGVSVALFDHRGYGRSSGVPTVATLQADALRIYDHMRAQYPGGVIVHGQSLGSFLAAHVAQHRPQARAIVLEATSSTVQAWTDANVPWYVKLVTKVEVDPNLHAVDNVSAMRAYSGASLVLVGENDQITPPALARKVFDAIPSQDKQWFMAPGASHNGIFGHKAVMPVYCRFVGK